MTPSVFEIPSSINRKGKLQYEEQSTRLSLDPVGDGLGQAHLAFWSLQDFFLAAVGGGGD